ncbi:2-succinyl-6-hydroxy-2, 4-cyclohexadiene-1-carboxylate synthase [Parvicella tangerina]|uniref:2-succinyl-6-hydroxy-2, 4-cyclohexadiene-1-carboxylate synthase n=2 Tax=Parvicella tangerina TaxID=2829795 RepID=A0A916NIF9_9FLAO|nr:2-succinyl-6-hydroxy-2, 4-cyclohexadiene-1-carboxylate synthase [Parvicella tangerina]
MRLIRFYFHRVSALTPRVATKLFWHLFTKPRPRKFAKTDESFYEKASQEKVLSQKFKAEFLLNKRGNGDNRVLILHGWEGRSSDFSKLITQLEKVATVYALDFPGHGKSPKSRAHLPMFVDVIESALNHLAEVDTVIGHSLGAASLAMAVGQGDYSNQLKNLVFMGLHPEPSQYFLQYKRVTKVNDIVFERCVRMAEEKTSAKLLDYSCYNYLEKYERFAMHFIHDEKDKIIRVDRVEDLANKLSDSEVFKGDHGGHFRHYKSDEVIEYILKISSEIDAKKD